MPLYWMNVCVLSSIQFYHLVGPCIHHHSQGTKELQHQIDPCVVLLKHIHLPPVPTAFFVVIV